MNAAPTVPTPPAPTFAALAAHFARGATPCRYVDALFDGRRVYSYDALVAQRLSATEVWISTATHGAATGKHVAALRRVAISYGLNVVDGPKPPANHDGFAPLPALLLADALLVVEALQRHATACRAPEVADRARRLAAIYRAAADGDSPLAAALYLALPPLPKE